MRKPGFPTRSDTNRDVHLQKMPRGLKFQIKEVFVFNCTIYIVNTKVMISCMVTAQLICTFHLSFCISLKQVF